MRATRPPKEIAMRKLMLPLALVGAAALTGCVGYGGGVYSSGGYYDNSPYYGGSYYGGAPYYGSGGSVGVVIEQRSGYPYSGYTRRDRDGDGVPDRYDSRPNNPRRY
jgi:hypothetical protein